MPVWRLLLLEVAPGVCYLPGLNAAAVVLPTSPAENRNQASLKPTEHIIILGTDPKKDPDPPFKWQRI